MPGGYARWGHVRSTFHPSSVKLMPSLKDLPRRIGKGGWPRLAGGNGEIFRLLWVAILMVQERDLVGDKDLLGVDGCNSGYLNAGEGVTTRYIRCGVWTGLSLC